ncbi:MAG: 2-oxoglutarate dehydrogenase complex dihydrolipoyllysine-residue succinyltransferase [Hyphomonadaceae bacterium]
MTDITVPQLGESVTEATVGQWLKAAGDAVSKDEVLVELETDKVSIEVSAPEDGTLTVIDAEEGAIVNIGALLGKVGGSNGAAKPVPKAKAPTAAKPASPAKAAKSSAGTSIEVVIPTMGESVTEGTVAALLKQPGDAVVKDESLIEIETDKVAIEVPSPADGVVAEYLVAEGDIVTPGAVIARVTAGTDATASAPATTTPTVSATSSTPVAPSVRRISAENGIDPASIPGTGKGGRATKGDALAYLDKGSSASAPAAAAQAPRDIGPREERVRMSRLRQTIARRLKEAQNTAAMLTTFNDVDMSEIMALRKTYKESFLEKHGVKLGFMSFFVKACVNALKEVPTVNAEIDGTDIIYKNHYDLGIAVGTDKGLVVPVVRDCDQLSLAGIEQAIGALGKKARDGKLAMADLQGGTFTLSNGGVYGSMMSTPILNPPQSGVLGMHRIEQRPIAMNGEVVIRPMMYLALSYDHRIVDGKEAVTFLVRVKEALEDPERMLLDV